MNILIKTKVNQNFEKVFRGFDLSLFKALKPPMLSLDVIRFDGCKKGDQVHLQVGIGRLSQSWVSLITSDFQNESECQFVDEGEKLPPPLKDWRHIHRIVKIDDNRSEIHDNITYSTGNKILDYIIYPALYAQFIMRVPVYKKIFK